VTDLSESRPRACGDMAGEVEFIELYERLCDQGYRAAFRLLGRAAAAEDACAEGFARAYARWPQVRVLPHREAWIIRVISNVALDALGKKSPVPPLPWMGSVEDAVATRLALVGALEALPSRQREVIVLHHLGGYGRQEVAAALGISPGTVKTHLKRGMATLRERLGPTREVQVAQ